MPESRADQMKRVLKRQQRARSDEHDRHRLELAARLEGLGFRPAMRGGRGSGKR